MSALRVTFSCESSEFSDTVPDVVLDCWKAELYIGLDPAAQWAVNGVLIPSGIVVPSAGAAQRLPIVLEYGGMMNERDEPVNLNDVLTFSNVSGGARLLQYLLVKTYLDPRLTDPQR